MASKGRVAIVDDHALFVDSLRPQLELAGYDVAWTGDDPAELAACQIDLDVVLLDLDLGTRWVSTHDVEAVSAATAARIVIVTGFPNYELLADLIMAGAVTVVDKRDPVAKLTATLDTVVQEGVDLSPLVAATLASTFRPVHMELSPQEARVLALYGSGLTIAEVASSLHISVHTVKEYLRRVRRKLAEEDHPASSQIDLYRAARMLGVLEE